MKTTARTILTSAASMLVLLLAVAPAFAQSDTVDFDIGAQPLSKALMEYSEQTNIVVMASAGLVEGKESGGVEGVDDPGAALHTLLVSTGLEHRFVNDETVVIRAMDGGDTDSGKPQPASSPVLMAQNQTSVTQEQTSRTNSTTGNDEEEAVLEEIVVTGTNIRGVSPDSSPSFVFDREDIDKTGFGTVSELIQSLPQNFGGGSNTDTRVGGVPGDRTVRQNIASGSSVNLRGVGSGSTLVLLNGRRLAPAGNLGDFVDISMIPLSAVERVEVLTDGASAIYGADAIAGVVNFVLRDDYDGAETFVRFGSVTEGDLQEYRVGQTLGKRWATGNAIASYEFHHRDNLGAEDRKFSSAAVLPADLLPEQRSHNMLLSASQELSNRIKLRGHGTFSQRDGLNVFDGLGRTISIDSRTKQYGGSAGAEIDLVGDWLLDVSGSYQQLLSFSTQIDPLGNSTAETDSDLWSVDGKADGTLFNLPGGDVKIAAGLSYREETFVLSDGVGGDPSREDDRTVFGAFVEALVPFVGADNRSPGFERLELTLAGRHDDYNDFGRTFNPKVGLLWSPLEGLNLRSTYSTSFNPPNLGDTGTSGGFVVPFFATNPASATGTSLVVIDLRRRNRDLGPEESTTWTVGVDYGHEVGPGDLDVSLTWFDINYTDRIELAGNPFGGGFLNDPVTFAGVITADPDPALIADIIAEVIADGGILFDFTGGVWTMPGDEDFLLDGRLLNLAGVDTSGLDLNLAYTVDADIGQLNFGLNGNYLFKQKKQITSKAPALDVVDTVFNPVDLRLRGSASWSRDGWGVSTFVNYVDSYVDDRNLLGVGDVPVESWTTVDFNLSYDAGEGSGDTLLDNTKFSLSVLNLFNQDPPRVEVDGFSFAGFDPTNASALGRFISFQVTKVW